MPDTILEAYAAARKTRIGYRARSLIERLDDHTKNLFPISWSVNVKQRWIHYLAKCFAEFPRIPSDTGIPSQSLYCFYWWMMRITVDVLVYWTITARPRKVGRCLLLPRRDSLMASCSIACSTNLTWCSHVITSRVLHIECLLIIFYKTYSLKHRNAYRELPLSICLIYLIVIWAGTIPFQSCYLSNKIMMTIGHTTHQHWGCFVSPSTTNNTRGRNKNVHK